MHADRMFADDFDRLTTMKRGWDYYEGRHPDMLQVLPGEPNDNTRINLARTIVNRGIAFLLGNELTWQFDETDATTTPAEAYVRGIWDANAKMTLLHEVAQNGFITGVAAIKVAPQPDGTIRLINLNPVDLRLFSAPDDSDDVWCFVVKYCADDRGVPVHYAEITERTGPRGSATWQITTYRAAGGARSYTPVGGPIAWPYALPPILACKNWPRANCPYGYSDLEDTDLMDALNLSASSTRKTLRLFPDPQDVLFGASAKGLRRGGEHIWGDLPATARVERLELSADALDAARQHAIDTRAAIFAGAQMPDISTEARLGQLTNFGLRVLYMDLLHKNNTKRIMYGGLINRVNQLLAAIGGFGPVETSFTWPDPLPADELAQIQAVTQKRASGLVDDETLTTELGYDYEDVQARLRQQRLRDTPPVSAAAPPGDPQTRMQPEGG
ncbi:MAG TPA: phage portal protein [Kouleothrix sp.]|nr:phage portal protein [Kouleothrix sp.]